MYVVAFYLYHVTLLKCNSLFAPNFDFLMADLIKFRTTNKALLVQISPYRLAHHGHLNGINSFQLLHLECWGDVLN